MSITGAQARRALWHADIPWDAQVDDPRESPWVVHDHQGILSGLAPAFAVGRRNLRQAEDFFADLGVGARRALGLGRGSPCDTTLHRLLAQQSPAGLEETVFAHVKDLIARKVVKNDRLALGVLSIDGKGIRTPHVPAARDTSSNDACSATARVLPTGRAGAPPILN